MTLSVPVSALRVLAYQLLTITTQLCVRLCIPRQLQRNHSFLSLYLILFYRTLHVSMSIVLQIHILLRNSMCESITYKSRWELQICLRIWTALIKDVCECLQNSRSFSSFTLWQISHVYALIHQSVELNFTGYLRVEASLLLSLYATTAGHTLSISLYWCCWFWYILLYRYITC